MTALKVYSAKPIPDTNNKSSIPFRLHFNQMEFDTPYELAEYAARVAAAGYDLYMEGVPSNWRYHRFIDGNYTFNGIVKTFK